MKISAVIITFNEDKNLTRCLQSIKSIADEIVVVDSGSTDRTVEIAKKNGAKILTRKFDNYANQRNFALGRASGEWILSIDADEEITSDLAEEIKLVASQQSSAFNAYSIPRKNIIFGKFIKYTRWQPELDRHIWFWRKGMGKWEGDVHEELKVDGKIGKFKNPKVHHQYETVSEFLEMMNKYSSLEIKRKFSLVRFIWDPFYNFFVRYIYRLGFLDGRRGFILSYLMAVYQLEVWVKNWEKHK